MSTDEVSQKGAKDMSQKNMEVMLSMEDKAEAEELTAFLQSVNITKQTLMDTFLKGVKVGASMSLRKSRHKGGTTLIERWKDIPGYDGKYQASTEGNIRRTLKSGQFRSILPITKNERESAPGCEAHTYSPSPV